MNAGDKTNQPPLPVVVPAAAAAGPEVDLSDDSDDDDRKDASSRAALLQSVPAAHPRYTGSAGRWLHRAQRMWREVRGQCVGTDPLFCRVEPARQTVKVPVGAVRTTFNGKDCYMWPGTKVSPYRIKRELVAMLTPIIGASRAARRTAAGFRGGGEMELARLGKPVDVRATIGWWVARRIATEGQIVVYEGSSIESMWAATSDLGSSYMRVLAPGVYTTSPPGRLVSRSVMQRATARRVAPRAPAK